MSVKKSQPCGKGCFTYHRHQSFEFQKINLEFLQLPLVLGCTIAYKRKLSNLCHQSILSHFFRFLAGKSKVQVTKLRFSMDFKQDELEISSVYHLFEKSSIEF